MKQQDYIWLHNNAKLFGNVKPSREELQRLFDIYNYITGENKPITSCGRCVHNIKKRLFVEYEKVQRLQR